MCRHPGRSAWQGCSSDKAPNMAALLQSRLHGLQLHLRLLLGRDIKARDHQHWCHLSHGILHASPHTGGDLGSPVYMKKSTCISVCLYDQIDVVPLAVKQVWAWRWWSADCNLTRGLWSCVELHTFAAVVPCMDRTDKRHAWQADPRPLHEWLLFETCIPAVLLVHAHLCRPHFILRVS